MFVAYVQNTTCAIVRKKSEVDLTHDWSSQFQFDLIQAQTMAPSFCLHKVPIRHFQANIAILPIL